MKNLMKTILRRAVYHYGPMNQRLKAVEEFGELSTALARDLQGHGDPANIAEEMADAWIMLEQLEIIYGNREQMTAAMAQKLMRLEQRINGGGAHE